jgi:GT2 family glycosyltransferase/glycosyltransferase involved in cell wall biosynthesis
VTTAGTAPVDTISAVLFEYLRSAHKPDEAFIEWLFTIAQHPTSIPADILDVARIAAQLAAARIGLPWPQPPQLEPDPLIQAHAEIHSLQERIDQLTQLRNRLEHALVQAQQELNAARPFAQALPRAVPKRKGPEPNFDEAMYLALYPDAAEAVRTRAYKSGYDHLLHIGEAEGKIAPQRHNRVGIPPYFDEDAYLQEYPEVVDAIEDGRFLSGFHHWITTGLRNGYTFISTGGAPEEAHEPGYDEGLYLFFNPDVAAAVRNGAFPNGYEHWRHHGNFEGRAGGPLDLVEDRRQFRKTLASRSYGVNLYGFLSAISGLGSLARGTVQALESQAVPLQTVNVAPWADTTSERRNTIDNPYRINLILQNADVMGRFTRSYETDLLHGGYNIGYWLWELPSPRMDWFANYRYVDEVWVASEYCQRAFQTLTRLPVTRMPLVVDGLDEKAVYGREHFGFPDDVFVFCYIYDISSQLERKNPACLIEAFRREFGDSREVLLYLKTSNSDYDPARGKALAKMAAAANIRIFDGFLSDEEIVSLHKAADCFVSPHRAEGFGFNLAEAMYFGKPVIATGYSSNIDFMNEENSYLIDYRLVPIRENAGPYLKGFVWADPSVEHLQSLMRRVFDKQDERNAKGQRANEEIRTRYSAKAIGGMMQQRFRDLGLNAATPPRDLIRPLSMTAWPRFTPAGLPHGVRRQIGSFEYKPVISIVTPVYNVDPEYLRKCIESVRNQYYPHWELCLCDDASTRQDTRKALAEYQGSDPRIKIVWSERNLGIAGASNQAAEISSGEYIALLDNDDELTRDALFEVVKALNADREIDFFYTDEDKIESDGTYGDHYYKPDWSPEHLMSVMYLLHLLVFRKDLFYEAGGFRSEYSGAQDYDLALRMSRRARRIHHIPKILYHWRKIAGSAAATVDAKPSALMAAERALADHVKACGMDAEVQPGLYTGSFRVRRRIAGSPRVTLCITTNDGEAHVPGRGRINLVSHFVHSVAAKTEYRNYEILLVDNRNLSEQTRKALSGIDYRLESYTGPQKPFNFAHKANFAFSQVRTEHLVLLNDDMEVISPDWLSALLEWTQQKEIGIAGGRLLFVDDTVQHAGVVLGVNGCAAHVHYELPRDLIGYNGFSHVIRNYSAVTGACMATRREIIQQTGGFDEQLAIDFNDIGFCLSARERGYRVVYTPYCELYHFESVTSKRKLQNPKEVEYFLRRWGKYVDQDPYYNPNLTRFGGNFTGTRAASGISSTPLTSLQRA